VEHHINSLLKEEKLAIHQEIILDKDMLNIPMEINIMEIMSMELDKEKENMFMRTEIGTKEILKIIINME
jgi:hypothetical protein